MNYFNKQHINRGFLAGAAAVPPLANVGSVAATRLLDAKYFTNNEKSQRALPNIDNKRSDPDPVGSVVQHPGLLSKFFGSGSTELNLDADPISSKMPIRSIAIDHCLCPLFFHCHAKIRRSLILNIWLYSSH
uniref:Uncharacterized protein n=1 Tax=Romanomermis culicivorax TaxID=13658 RepID=A0A915L173_ROMCU